MRPDRAPDYICERWHALSDAEQIELARSALRYAWHSLADQAELLAGEMDSGALGDQGGAEALRLFGAILRVVSEHEEGSDPPGRSLATMSIQGHA